MTYLKLKVGDVRKAGDEQRAFGLGGYYKPRNFYDALTDWTPTRLVGHIILASDLMHLEYRRPKNAA